MDTGHITCNSTIVTETVLGSVTGEERGKTKEHVAWQHKRMDGPATEGSQRNTGETNGVMHPNDHVGYGLSEWVNAH